jgi:hypothetical protein
MASAQVHASAEAATSATETPSADASAVTPAAATAPGPAPASPPEALASSPEAAATPAPTTPDTAAADAEAASIEADLQSNVSGDAEGGFKLNLYGFADFSYRAGLTKTPLFADKPAFAVGKLNLYAATELGDNWRSLAEVRFMYLPNGNTPTTPGAQRFDTTVGDYSDFARPIQWGGIAIERAWLEHTIHPLLTLRVGHWLTPYGIWNVDHGSPVIIGVRRPFVIGEALLPESQTGLEAYGSIGFGPAQVGYHLTLSNGRGPVSTYRDYDNNKALGARLFLRHDSSFGSVTVGISGYRGKYTNAVLRYKVDANNQVSTTNDVSVRYDELSLSADVKWEWDSLLVQGEIASNDVAYVDAYRPPFVSLTGGPPGVAPDHRRFGYYGLVGYRTPLFGLMPFFGAEYYDPGLHLYNGKAWGVWGGLNVRPTARVVLKAQYTHGWFPEDQFRPLNLLDLQAAWSF